MNPVVHFEIPTQDLARASKFYESLFGWTLSAYPPSSKEYLMAATTKTNQFGVPIDPGAINGGLVTDKTTQAPIIVIRVDDVDEHTKKIEAAGGKLVMSKREIPSMGWYARVSDTEGNVIGLWQNI